jgi:hypothetical protein
MSSSRQELEAKWAALQEEEVRLLAEVPSMEPAVAARALRVLADRIAEVRSQYEQALEGGHEVDRDRQTEDRCPPGAEGDR